MSQRAQNAQLLDCPRVLINIFMLTAGFYSSEVLTSAALSAEICTLVFRSAFLGVGTNEFFPDEVGTVIAVVLQSEDVKQEYVMDSAPGGRDEAERLLKVSLR